MRPVEVEAQQNLTPVLAVGRWADGLHTLTCPPDGAVGARPVIINNNSNKEDFYSTRLPHMVGAEGALQ